MGIKAQHQASSTMMAFFLFFFLNVVESLLLGTLFDSLAAIFKLPICFPQEKTKKRLHFLSPSLASYSNLVISVIYFPGKCRAIT